MRRVILLAIALAGAAAAQTQELGLTLGRISGATRDLTSGKAELGSGIALQANYGIRLFTYKRTAISGEVHFLANGLREITSANRNVTRDVATLYVTPGVRVKYIVSKRFQPYGAIGGGYSLYEQSLFQLSGSANGAPRFTHHGVFAFGGGVDVPVWRWIGARFEVRDFYSGNPNFNVPVRGSGGQHNIVAGGGFVLSWGRRD